MPMTLTRSLLAVLIPGAIAITPIVVLALLATNSLSLYKEFAALANAFIFCLASIIGSFCEGLGTHFEVVWDGARERKFKVVENWYKYLARTFDSEPVGYRHLGRLATTLYFELSMSVALVFFAAGSGLLVYLHVEYLKIPLALLGALSCYGLSYYFYVQGHHTHATLCRTRRAINQSLDQLALRSTLVKA